MPEQLQDRARGLQQQAVSALLRGIDALERGHAAVVQEGPTLRANLVAALNSYQTFKHAELFEPGMASGSSATHEAAVRLKTDCVAAGETYRLHMQRWSFAEADQHWSDYHAAARLTAKVLRRAIVDQLPGILSLAGRLLDEQRLGRDVRGSGGAINAREDRAASRG